MVFFKAARKQNFPKGTLKVYSNLKFILLCSLFQLLQRIIAKNRTESQGELHNFMMGPAIDVTVNRNYIYQDAFDQLTEDKGKP